MAEIKNKEVQIEKLKQDLVVKERELQEKKQKLNQYKIFTKFLEDVIDNKMEENKEFEDIESLKNWFKNLREKNEELTARKLQIEFDLDQTKKKEAETVTKL